MRTPHDFESFEAKLLRKYYSIRLQLEQSVRRGFWPLDALIQHQTHQTSQTLKTNVKDRRGLNALNPPNIPNPQDQCETIGRAGVVFLRTPAASETFHGGGGDCRQCQVR